LSITGALTASTLTLLKAGFLILLYLFLFRAIRAVYLEISPKRVRAPAQRRHRRPIPPREPGPLQPVFSKAPPSELRLVAPSESTGKTWPLSDGELVIGRGSMCGVQVDDSFASQRHARLVLRGGAWWVEDLGSTNGTTLNHESVTQPKQVERGDRLQVGQTVFELRG
jgi:hypothetical protein